MKTTSPLLRIMAGLGLLSLAGMLYIFWRGHALFDDAYMFWRYTGNLLETGRMSWNPGEEAVYGPTSVLYVIALIPFRLLLPDAVPVALWLSSVLWGLVFLGLAARLSLRVAARAGFSREWTWGLLWLCLPGGLYTLAPVMATGMDTTFAMSMGALWLLGLERLLVAPGRALAWALGLGAGLCWWVRPDLCLLVWPVGGITWLLTAKGSLRTALLHLNLGTVAGALGCLGLSAWLLHSPAPLSFFVKSAGIYGPGFESHYAGLGIYYFTRFLAGYWPLGLLVGLGVWVRMGNGLPRNPLLWGLMGGMAVFFVYESFFVLHVMGMNSRLIYPALPFLLLLAMYELTAFPENFRRNAGPLAETAAPYLTLSKILLGLALLGSLFLDARKAGKLLKEDATMDQWKTWQAHAQDYWWRLDLVAAMDPRAVIGSTEVGYPGSLCPDRKILDLSGLNEPRLSRERMGIGALIREAQPDFLWLPHPHYEDFMTALQADTAFQRMYAVWDAAAIHCHMGVALRRDSPWTGPLRAALPPPPIR